MQKTEGRIPSLASWDFHTRFFPALLTKRFRPASQPGSGFVSSGFMEGAIILAIAGILIAVGALLYASLPLIGLAMLVLGITGLGYIFYLSIIGAKGITPSYNNFLFGLFLLLLLLGATLGLAAAPRHSGWLKVLFGALGTAAGYWIGLLAGMHMQRLGFVSAILNVLSVYGAIGLSVVTILLLL